MNRYRNLFAAWACVIALTVASVQLLAKDTPNSDAKKAEPKATIMNYTNRLRTHSIKSNATTSKKLIAAN